MYITFFIIGFMSSFGWWTAGKVQKELDKPTPVELSVPAISLD
jgi:hypothetical protein